MKATIWTVFLMIVIVTIHAPFGTNRTVTRPLTAPVTTTSLNPARTVPSGSREQAVQAYYDAVASRQLSTAYALLSPAAQRRHPFAEFESYQNDITKTDYEVLSSTPGGVPVFVCERHASDPDHEMRLTGSWAVVRSSDGSRWLLNRGVFGQTTRVALSAGPTNAPTIDATVTTSGNRLTSSTAAAANDETQRVAQSADSSVSTPAVYGSAPVSGITMFHGFLCNESSCSGHRAGYDWAESRGIDEPST